MDAVINIGLSLGEVIILGQIARVDRDFAASHNQPPIAELQSLWEKVRTAILPAVLSSDEQITPRKRKP